MKKYLAVILSLILTLSAVMLIPTVPTNAGSEETVYHQWDFENGITGWGDSLSSSVKLNYTPEKAETTALSFDFAYNKSEAGNWNNSPIFSSPTYMGRIEGSTAITFDLYLEKGKATTGSIEVYPIIQSPEHNYWFQLDFTEISAVSGGTDVGNGLMKYTITKELKNSAGEALSPTDIIHVLTFTNCGKFTDYNGKIYYDNIRLISFPKELSVSTSLKGEAVAEAGDTITVTCNAEGGNAPYKYTFYALKEGKVEYKSDIWTGKNTAEITLNEAGTYKILTYCRDSEGKKLSVRDEVTVYQDVIKPTGITLSESSLSIERGKTATVTATVTPSNAMDKTVTFTSDNPAVAKVDQKGAITGASAGTAVITAATSNGLTAKVNVTVTKSSEQKYIALTFDDGPDSGTGEILDILKEKNAKATFFVLYNNAQYNTALLKRAAEEVTSLETTPKLTPISHSSLSRRRKRRLIL